MRFYHHPPSPSTPTATVRLSPRRRLISDYLLEHLVWRGGKLLLRADVLSELRHRYGVGFQAVLLAADDLYALGIADMHLAGETPVLMLRPVGAARGAA